MSEEKKGFFKRLVSGLTKTRDNIVAGFDSIFSGYSSIDDDFYEELEEILIMGDIGINATSCNHRTSERTGGRETYQKSDGMQTASDQQHQRTDACGQYRI